MARYTPLLVALRGKLGDNVYCINGTVRRYVPTGLPYNTTPQYAFANLTKQWPYSDSRYKAVCGTKYRRGMPDGGLARQVPALIDHSHHVGAWRELTTELLVPDQLDALPGEHGSEWQLLPTTVLINWESAGLRLRWHLKHAPTWVGNTYMAYLLMPIIQSLSGHDEANLFGPWMGVQVVDWADCQGPQAYQHTDTRCSEAEYYAGRVFCAAVAWYTDEITHKRIIIMGTTSSCAGAGP